MATTNTMFILEPRAYTPPATLFATLDTIADSSTPVLSIPVLDFDATTAEFADWFVTVPSHYAGGGFTVSWKGGTDADDTGSLILDVIITVIADAAILTGDLGADTGTAAAMSDTPPATPINKLNYSATATITHANAGSPSVGNRLIIRAARNIADNNGGDLQLAEILILET